MLRALRFVLPLLVVLALLAFGATTALNGISRQWFERDVDLRAQLLVDGAREAFALHFREGDRARMARLLAAIARHDRIMGAAACGPDLRPFARTRDYPAEFGCDVVGPRLVRAASGPPADADAPDVWSDVAATSGGRIHVAAVPVVENDVPLGSVIVLHDMSFADRRAATMARIALVAFLVLAVAASVTTIFLARGFWRSWTAQIRELLRGRQSGREFHPLLRDIRELVTDLVTESQSETRGLWGPERLRKTLQQHLHGETVLIAANREPYIHERAADGRIEVFHPASGLVTALEPVMRACSGVWVAHGNGSADRDTVDLHGRVAVPPGEESYLIRRVWLSREEENGYYYGFANEGLWPLCHVAHTRPYFRSEDWAHYRHVNAMFAEAVCEEADRDDPIILVQDYHFALVPRLVRDRLPRATIITFWHIPWPNAERFGICPFAEEILSGLLGSSIVGFHTQLHCNNFLEGIDRFLEARIDRELQGVVQGGRTTLVRPYPISIEWPNHWAAAAPPAAECRASVLAELGLPPDTLLGVGVDRLDYTKGIEERLLAVERLLEVQPWLHGRFVFVQLAAPSRTAIERYQELDRSVERLAARINERFGRGSYRPIVLARKHHEPPTVFRYYRAADVCYVSSLHDGMNLVAKEFVAAREDERGVLVLSRFTGAARELTEALIVNPYDLDESAAALGAALAMPAEEQRTRMRAMRLLVTEYNVYRWAGRMLVDAARLRRRDRLPGSRRTPGQEWARVG